MTNLLYSHEEWGRLVDERQGVDVILLDLSKAFNSVPHNLLLTKLSGLGIGRDLLRWIRNYLDNRSFRVKVNGVLSDPKAIIRGVP